MSKIACDACQNLRENAPEFVNNGVTSTVSASLKNNTGFNPKLTALHTDCEDLNDANDCLIGQMDNQIESHDVCDWKQYMHKFVPNLYELLKAMIASMCGIWTNINRIWKDINKIWCWLENIATTPKSYSIRAYEDNDPSKRPLNGFRIADGVVMRQPGIGSAPITCTVLGTTFSTTGSLNFNGNMPKDYTNGEEVPWSYLKHGCAALTNKAGVSWGANGLCVTQPLIWEIQFKKCQLGFDRFFGNTQRVLHCTRAGTALFGVYLYRKGQLVPPDYSAASTDDGDYFPGYYTFNPDDDDMMLMQVRLADTRTAMASLTVVGTIPVIACPDSWSC